MEAQRTRPARPEGEEASLSAALARAARRPPTHRLHDDLAALLEASSDALDAARVSVWTFEPGNDAIQCLALFDKATRSRAWGARIDAAQAPAYFAALQEARVIDAHDAATDPRTREFAPWYLAPLGITSMLDAPVRLDGRLVGIVCHEHVGPRRTWTQEEQAFAAGIADLAAHALRADELRSERDLLRTLLQAQSDLGEGVAVVDPQRRLVYANDALARILGHPLDELRAFPDAVAAVTSERSRAPWEERTARLAAGLPVAPHIESYIRTKAGEDVPVEIVGINVALGDQRGRLFIVRDITERLRREEAARVLDALVQATADAVVTADAQGIVRAWNPGAERLLGWSAQEMVGRHFRTFVPHDLLADVDRLERLRAGEAIAPYETERLHKDGRRIPVSVNVTPMRGPDGGLVAVTAILRDRSAQKALEEARRQLAQSEKLSALGSLVSGVAHEIRTPLTYLQTNLHLASTAVRRALEAAPPDARDAALGRVEAAFAEMQESVTRINRLVADLRRYTQLRVGQTRSRARLDEVVQPAVDMFRATSRGAVKLDADLQRTPPLLVDALEVQQVVLNLLQNAAEAAPHDGLVRVRTRATPDGGAAIEVEDRGAGMPADVQARVFDAFFTTKAQGTGLGLSIVKRIVDAHGGSIALDSRPGEGTRVVVTFRGG